MSFPYKHILMIGATSGIGKAVANRLIQAGIKVTVVGRRQDRLDDFVKKHGENKAQGIAFDIGNLAAIPQFAADFVGLVHAFLPFLLKKESNTSIVFTGSHLAIVPAFSLPAYSASKAALNAFTLCLREQLKNSHVNVIEISPPVVQTELHDYVGESRGRSMGMPVDEFAEKAFEGLVSGSDQILIGTMPSTTFPEIVDMRRAAFDNLTKRIRGLS